MIIGRHYICVCVWFELWIYERTNTYIQFCQMSNDLIDFNVCLIYTIKNLIQKQNNQFCQMPPKIMYSFILKYIFFYFLEILSKMLIKNTTVNVVWNFIFLLLSNGSVDEKCDRKVVWFLFKIILLRQNVEIFQRWSMQLTVTECFRFFFVQYFQLFPKKKSHLILNAQANATNTVART